MLRKFKNSLAKLKSKLGIAQERKGGVNKDGLTLIEVIISALILALTTGCLLFVFSTEKMVVARTGRRIQAMDFTRQTLEGLKNAVRADTWDGSGQPLSIQGWTSWGSLSGDFATKFAGQRRYRVEQVSGIDPSTAYRSVTVTVDWSEPTE